MSNKLECCAVAHWREVAESNEQLASNLSAEIARLTAEVERLQHDVFAYRLALGYEIPGDHDGLLSDGRQPLNGPALAAWGHYDTLRWWMRWRSATTSGTTARSTTA